MGAGLFAAGGLLGGFGAASCCILPLTLFSLGAGGAWLGNLAALAPYQWFFIAPSLILLAAGFVTVYRPSRNADADGQVCPAAGPRRLIKAALWSATALIAAAIAFPYLAPPLLGV